MDSMPVSPTADISADTDDSFWPYLDAMLRSKGACDCKHVHTMLGLLADGFEKSLNETEEWLEDLCRNGRLVRTPAGTYELTKQKE